MELSKLKGKLKEMNLTYEDCASQLHISIASFNDKINGRNSFKWDEVQGLIKFLKLSDSEFRRIFLE